MNPILLNPKIENDKSTTEQLQQMRSYLFQFKEQIELILSNIDSDNVSKNYEDALYGEFSRKFGDSESMSQIIQTQSLIKLEVKEAVKMGDDKYSSFAITANGIKIKSTGTFTVDSGNFSINSDGDVHVNGNINALSGSIGGYKIESDTIRTNQPSASKPGLALVSGVSEDEIALAIGFTSASDYSTSRFYVNGNGKLHATEADIEGKVTANKGTIGGFILAADGLYSDLGTRTVLTLGAELTIGDKNERETWVKGTQVRLQGKDGNSYIIMGYDANNDGQIGMQAKEANIRADVNIDSSYALNAYKLKAGNGGTRSISWEQITYIDDYGAVQSKYLLSGGNV